MWDKIKSMMGGESTDKEDELDPKLAAAALMVEAALADGIYADVEERAICQALEEAFQIPETECRALLDKAEELAEQSIDHYRFTARVKTLPLQQRTALVKALWKVVFADGEESPFEEAFVRKIMPLLAVSDRDSRFARKEARDNAQQTD